LEKLNETATTYLNEKSVDKEFSKYTDQIQTKLDSFVVDLEKELNESLKKTCHQKQLNSNTSKLIANNTETSATTTTTNNNNNNKNNFQSDLNKLKSNVREYMDSMLVKMHNDIWYEYFFSFEICIQ
jgi:hypothetical protein